MNQEWVFKKLAMINIKNSLLKTKTYAEKALQAFCNSFIFIDWHNTNASGTWLLPPKDPSYTYD